MYSVKEKSWSVRITFGYVTNGQVRSHNCGNCAFNAKLVIGNNDNSNLLLYGCDTRKCRHILMKVDLGSSDEENFSGLATPETFQFIPQGPHTTQIQSSTSL